MSGRVLNGRTVLLTRPRAADATLSRALRRAGARVLRRPTIETRAHAGGALDDSLRRLDDFDWLVFTSAEGVSSFLKRLRVLRIDVSRVQTKQVAVVGPVTAAVATRGGLRVTAVGTPHSAAGLIATLQPLLRGRPAMLYPRAAHPLPTLANGLRRLGARVTDVTAYETNAADTSGVASALDQGVDCVVFCSPSAIGPVLPLHDRIRGCTVACIGPTTARAAREAGLPVRIVPPQATGLALATAVIAYYREGPR
jgi:uroporphyrinogen III methyltransferase/synthase